MTTKTTMSPPPMTKKKSKTGAALLCSFALAAVVSSAMPARAALGGHGAVASSTTKVPKLRTIEGEVCRKDGAAIQGAVVYLQDTKSLAVKSYLSDDQGHFHFRQLSMSLDYDLWAELNGVRSKTKRISQFNSKPDLSYQLKLAAGK